MLNKKGLIFSIWITSSIISLLLSFSTNAIILASLKPIGFIAAAIADGVTPVDILLPDGSSEHSYALRPSDIQRLKNADLVIWVGPEIEFFMIKYALGLSPEKNVEMDKIAGIKLLFINNKKDKNNFFLHKRSIKNNKCNHHTSQYNMHLWMSPEIAKKTARIIYNKLLKIMPQKKDKLDANLLQFEHDISSTNTKIMNQLSPVKNKGYFVFHDAYTYFEKYFDLHPLGYFTINPSIQPGLQHLNQIRKQLFKQGKATCVFAEPQFKPTAIKLVAKGMAVRLGILDPLGTNIILGRDSYVKFLSQLSNQYVSCLKE